MKDLILIADDDEAQLTLFADVLQAAGYDTLTIGNGRRAVELARSAKPRLILMDLDMPRLGGSSAIKILKQDPETQAIPVVAVTALAIEGDCQRALHAGFDAYICKPVHATQLRSVVRHHLHALPDVTAPRRSQEAPPAPDHSNRIARRDTGSIGRVLVVDDEELNRKLFRDILEAQGHEVILAEDGEQAVATAFAERPDAVLLDIMMPKLDGFEVCRRLRQDARTVHVPILIVTSLQDRPARLAGIRAGANDFLTKPIEAEELRLRVRNAVSAKHLYDRVQEDYVRLEALQALRDNLSDMIVHDMRSPLLAVSASYEVLSDEEDRLSERQQQFLALGRRSCLEVIEILNSLLDVSRMEAGQMPLNLAPVDILAAAMAAAASVAVLARQEALTIDVSGESAAVTADREIVHRVLVNLLGNAIKASPTGAAIRVRVADTATAVRVTVADQGPGISPEHHQRIFEKFGQVGSRGSEVTRSTGLGLAFCKLAVEAHGGRIGVDSQPDQGSTFWFTLPRRP